MNYAETRGEYIRKHADDDYRDWLYHNKKDKEAENMPITASAENGDYEKFMFEPGRYDAVCFEVVDLGTHIQEYQGKKTKARKCIIGFEVPSEMMELEHEDKSKYEMPRVISRQLTISLSEKSNMRPPLGS